MKLLRLFRWVSILSLAATFVAVTPCGAAEAANVFTLESFKYYLSSPPRVQRMVFQRKLEVTPVAFRSRSDAEKFLKTLAAGAKPPGAANELYFLRYQSEPSGHLFRRINSVFDLTNDAPREVFTGHYGSRWWWLQDAELTWMEYDIKRHKVGTVMICNEAVRQATEVLRFGMFELLPATFKWDSSSIGNFACQSEFLGPVSGSVQVSASGRVESARYRLASGEQKRIEFRYKADLPGGWPSEIDIWINRGSGDENLYSKFTIKEMELAESEIPEGEFMPNRYVREKDDFQKEITQDGKTFRLDGTNRTLMSAISFADSERRAFIHGRPIKYLLLAMVAIPPLFMVFRQRRNNSKERNNK